MDETANLNLPYLMPAQAQKHVTHNAALTRLDALVQLSVLDRDLDTPPGSPSEGDRYIVASDGSGDWDGWDGSITTYADGAWIELVAREGWLCWIADEALLVWFDGADWQELETGGAGAAEDVTFTPAGGIAATDVQAAIEELDTEKAAVASPALTGTPTAPTATPGTDTTQIATTAFVQEAIGGLGGGGASAAEDVTFAPAGTIAATDVQAAFEELDGDVGALASAIAALDADDIDDTSTTHKFATAAEKTKVGHLAVTQAVDLDAIETKVNHLTVTQAVDLDAIETKTNHLTVTQAVDLDTLESAVAALLAAAITRTEPGGRLTLTTGVPVLAADVTAATTIRYALYQHDLIPIYSGSAWALHAFTELSLPLNSNSGHTGYHQSGKNFDLFVVNDSGTLRLVSGPAWTNDTTRVDAINRLNGILTNTSTMTVRFGTSSGDTLSVAANRATYVGTFRASANGQTQVKFGAAAAPADEAWFGLWNMYNRVSGAPYVRDTTASWTYNSSTKRAARAQSTFRVSMVRGLDEDQVLATYCPLMFASSTIFDTAAVSIGLDATNATASRSAEVFVQTRTASEESNVISAPANFAGLPGLGFHYLQAIEWAAQGTGTYFGGGSALTAALRW